MPTQLKVSHSNFWRRFQIQGSIFHRALEQNYDVEFVEPHQSDLDFTSCFFSKKLGARIKGMRKRPADQKQIFFLGEPENIEPDRYHGVITGNLISDPRHYRLPLWILYCNFFGESYRVVDQLESQYVLGDFLNRPSRAEWENRSALFSAIFSNPQHYRIDIVTQLQKHGAGMIGGPIVNRWVDDKLEFIRQSRINVCFENVAMPGYHTEKPIQASIAGCVPLWFGDESAALDFNPAGMVNAKLYGLNVERILDEVDLFEVVQTPLITKVPQHFFDGLVDFLQATVEGDGQARCLSTNL